MTSATPQQPESALVETQNAAAEQTTLPAWHRPTIARIDIKRTLAGKGSNLDGTGPSNI